MKLESNVFIFQPKARISSLYNLCYHLDSSITYQTLKKIERWQLLQFLFTTN